MDIVEQLERTRQETLGYFGLAEVELAKRYAPEKWSVRWILHHLWDAHLEHIRKALTT